ncbi:ABC transporter, periplasmic spermidine putrescine-binding protein PotD [Candidatus Rhodobacter oscarellae]|uniref:Putrescine-binding periplasmic protein n=1 Tax=Candidatus Rhodobacter oscarellae TaxID=1675527 RepID=A0A0J9E7R7_9RHOB|nr:extracellular solute-binding protein [Candidatus Rhodobacter lobularis]KMW58790.1 ABC transporter, periplasmic spermidine putrescine-binding protein PotD [Candidatus Rhodobacter lobularis]
MKRLMTTAAAFAVSATGAMAEGELVIYHWFEYIPQDLLEKFTAETGINVTMDTYDSNESMLAALKAGGMGTYDVAVPSDYMVDIMIGGGMLGEIAEGELANAGNMQAAWADPSFDPGRKHSIPYQWGSTSFSVNRDVYQGEINTTDILFNPPAELSGKINMLDSQGEVLAMASIHLGIPQCSTDREQLKALNDMLQGAKAHWASFNSDNSKDILVSGDAAVSQIWNGFGAKARNEGANIEYAYPKEGYVVWMDSVVLLKDAPNRDSAIKFMDFLLEPENIAAVTNFAQYSAGVEGVSDLLEGDLATQRESNPPADAGPGVFVQVCSEEVQVVYDQIWTNLKK